jgi:hypothetical protein
VIETVLLVHPTFPIAYSGVHYREEFGSSPMGSLNSIQEEKTVERERVGGILDP